MDEKKVGGVPLKFYVFGGLTVLALVAVSVIPSTMVYRLRLFDAVGLPDWMAEVLRAIIITATPLAVLSTGAVRVFAVSDTKHAEALTIAAVLEIISFVAEIVAALVNGHDIFALVGQGLFLSISVIAVSAALVLTISASGFYKLAVAHNEQSLAFDREYNKLWKEQMQTPQIRGVMIAAITEQIKAKSEDQAGRDLFEKDKTGVVPIGSNGNGQHSLNIKIPTLPDPKA